ncbi:MAG: hypothetical protein DWP97_04865 [Calditrichaeota bacterium]|nr:MAG: hypothetical protein DWP97_04865 [Calditrichota bacterium]
MLLPEIRQQWRNIMKQIKFIQMMLSVALLLLFAIGCSNDDPVSSDSNVNNNAEFTSIIQSGGDFTNPVPANDTLADTSFTDYIGSEAYFCNTKTISVTEAPANFPLFDPNADIIYPGNLLQGASLENATPDPIPVKRAGGTIVMTILNGSDSVSRYIPVVDLASVTQAQNDIISNASNALPARFTFTMEEVHTNEELALSLDVKAQYLKAKVGASLDFSSDKQYNRFLVKLNQSFFTMAYQLPTSYAEIFAPEVTPSDLTPYIGAGNPGAFIGSVTYGRIFYLLIESTEESQEIKASLDASFNAAVSSGSLETDARYLSELESVNVKAYAMGGESADAISAITTDFESLKNFLSQGGTINTGVPISYVVRSLSNPSKIVNVKINTEYDLTECITVQQSFENSIFWYRLDDSRFFEGTSTRISKLYNAFGDATLDAIPPSSTYGCELISGGIAGGTLPVMRFRSGVTNTDGMFQYPGLNFVDTNYTVFAVVKLENTAISYPEMFMFGSSAFQNQNLSLGFRDNTRMTLSHQFNKLDANTTADFTQFNIYTFVFDKVEGMKVYVNNETTPSGIDTTKTAPLTAYLGARIGSQYGNALQIAEIRAYGVAVNDEQRKFVVDELLTKFSL